MPFTVTATVAQEFFLRRSFLVGGGFPLTFRLFRFFFIRLLGSTGFVYDRPRLSLGLGHFPGCCFLSISLVALGSFYFRAIERVTQQWVADLRAVDQMVQNIELSWTK